MADKVSLKTLALARSAIKAAMIGLGVAKGSPCTIKSVEDATGGKNITFEWTASDYVTKQTRTVFFPDGEDGAYVANAEINSESHLIITLSDGTEIDAGEISGGGDSTEYEFAIEGTKLTVTDSSTGIKQSLQLPTSSAGGIVNDLPVGLDVGGIKKPKTYAAGTSVETILTDLLNPVVAPTIVAPKATLTSNASRFIYGFDENIGSVQFSLSFSRGSISTGGYRAGEATGYQIDGKSGQNVTINMDEKTGDTISITGAVSHAEGDVPKDSAGNPSGTALPAGSVNSNTITFRKKPYIYTTQSGSFARMPIAQYNASPLAIALANGDGVSSPVCKVALPAQAKSIEVRNELTNQFVNNRDEFDETTETIDGRTYYVYTDNRGTRSGERDLRFTF